MPIIPGSGIAHPLIQPRILLAGVGGIITDDANLTWDGAVLTEISTLAFGPQQVLRAINNGSAAYYNFQRSRAGTTDVQNNDNLGNYVWQGYFNGAYQSSALLGAIVSAPPSGSLVSSYLEVALSKISSLDTIVIVFHPDGVAIGNFVPTAALHIKAGTATAGTAPLKLTSGVALATPEDGALEYHSSHIYFTIGATRYQLDQQAGGSGFTDFTKDLGASRRSGTFDITGLSGLTAGKNVTMMQTMQAIATKGNARDESEMDYIDMTGYVVDATTIRASWWAPSVVVGTYAFAYQVSA